MKIFICVVALCVWPWVAAAAAADTAPAFAGDITTDTTWSGDVYLDGDLFVAPGATLTLEPGTRVTVSRQDPGSGWFRKRGSSYDVEIVVAGALDVRGAPDALVFFAPEADGSPDDAWPGFYLKDGGTLEAGHARFVGLRRPLPPKAVLSPDVYAVDGTRKKGSAYLPFWGHDGEGDRAFLYPDGTLIREEVIEANRGYSRWIYAPAFAVGSIPLTLLCLLGTCWAENGPHSSTFEKYWPVVLPAVAFGVGYLGGSENDARIGARRAQDKWLAERPDFTPLF